MFCTAQAIPCGRLLGVACDSRKGVCTRQRVPATCSGLACISMCEHACNNSDLHAFPQPRKPGERANLVADASTCDGPTSADHKTFLHARLQALLARIESRKRAKQRLSAAALRKACLPPIGWDVRLTLVGASRRLHARFSYSVGGFKDRRRADAVVHAMVASLSSRAAVILPHVVALNPPTMNLFFSLSDWIHDAVGELLPMLTFTTGRDVMGSWPVPDFTWSYFEGIISAEERPARAAAAARPVGGKTSGVVGDGSSRSPTRASTREPASTASVRGDSSWAAMRELLLNQSARTLDAREPAIM
jgi:hypothetical protein